jgi:hypothetical protein
MADPMRLMLFSPVLVLIAAAAGFAVCRILGIDPQPRAMALAAAAALAGAEAAAIPLLLTRGGDQAAAAQAGLVATLVQLLVSVVLAGVMILNKLSPGPAFTYWVLAFYWVLLMLVALSAAKVVKSAPPARAASAGGPTGTRPQ